MTISSEAINRIPSAIAGASSGALRLAVGATRALGAAAKVVVGGALRISCRAASKMPLFGMPDTKSSSSLSTFEAFKKETGTNTVALTDDQVRDVQGVVWAIAQDVIDVCEKHGIPYFMDGGSCLGAVRHQGFIPWDDDIDLAMARRDYERFIPLFKEAHSDRYWVHELSKAKGHYSPQTMIRLKGTTFRGKDDISADEAGIYVDIYPVENVFGNPVSRVLQGLVCDFAMLLLSCRKYAVHEGYYRWYAEGMQEAMRGVDRKVRIGRLAGFISVDRAARFANWAAGLCKNDDSKWVSIPSGWEHFFGGLNRRSLLFPTVTATFEGREVAIPNGYEAYLKGLYGDSYMELPPAEDRERHIVSQLDFGSAGHAGGRS